MGAQAARMLMERIHGYRGTPRAIRFEPTLLERASTGLPTQAYIP